MVAFSREVRKGSRSDWPALHNLLARASLVVCHDDMETTWRRMAAGHGALAYEAGRPTGAVTVRVSERQPFARLRLVAFRDYPIRVGTLDRLLDSVLPLALSAGASSWAFVGQPGDATEALEAIGFQLVQEVVELAKTGWDTPAEGNPDVVVRDAQQKDIPALLALDERAFAPLWWNDREALHSAWESATFFWVAEMEGGPVGYLVARDHPDGAYIVRVAVDPAWQRQGIGTALLHRVIRQYRLRDVTPLMLNTQSDNQEAGRLYAWFGFRPTGSRMWALCRPIE